MMRVLSKFRLRRDRLRSPFAILAATVLAVVMGVGGALSIAGSAGAISPPVPGVSPISDLNGLPGAISVAAPYIYALTANASAAPAANWGFELNDNASSPLNSVWQSGDDFLICVSEGDQNVGDNGWIDFAATPTVTVSGGSSGATKPSIAAVLVKNPADVSNDVLLTDCLDLHFLNSGDGAGLLPFTVLISGITYNTGAADPVGTIGTLGEYVDATVNTETIIVPPNAAIVAATVSANSPAVTLLPNSVNAAISPINVSESGVGVVDGDNIPGDLSTTSQGYICISASAGKFTGSPTISVSPSGTGGTATVTGEVSIISPAAGPNTGLSTLVAQVLAPSLTVPTTFVFSNLTVDAPAADGPVTVSAFIDDNSQCDNPLAVGLLVPGSLVFNPVTIYTVGSVGGSHGATASIYGLTSEGTAVAALENEFPPNPASFCLPQNAHPRPHRTSIGSTIILTVDANDGFDALSASYLASYANTGVLLTELNSNTVDSLTMQAIQQEGASTVIIVGGPSAVSNADQTELENTPAYQCGGTIPRGSDLSVQRIWGQTADGTAAAVATYVDSGYVGQYDISGAFGQYNDTTGTDSGASNNIPERTAILSTDLDSQDAESTSSMSYWDDFPILLTPKTALGPDAANALLDLGIQQVIEPGGPLAIADTVNTQLGAMGIAVLRLAGQDGSETSTQVARFELNSGTTTNGQPEGLNTSSEWGDCTDISTTGPHGTSSPHNPLSPENDGTSYYANCDAIVALVRGDFFADGITSSVVTGNVPMPVILTESPTVLGQYATSFFNQAGSPFGIDPVANPTAPFVPYTGVTVGEIQPFGGPLALAAATITAALQAISAGANP